MASPAQNPAGDPPQRPSMIQAMDQRYLHPLKANQVLINFNSQPTASWPIVRPASSESGADPSSVPGKT